MITLLAQKSAILATRQEIHRCKTNPAQMNHAIVSTTGCGDAATASAVVSDACSTLIDDE